MKKIASGAIATVLFVAALVFIVLKGYQIQLRGPIFVGLLPVAWFLAGVLQLVTGVPFATLSEKWDNLAGWQRGLLGIGVFLTGLFLLCVVIVAFALFLDWKQGIHRPLF
jgi:hypothetical protein